MVGLKAPFLEERSHLGSDHFLHGVDGSGLHRAVLLLLVRSDRRVQLLDGW